MKNTFLLYVISFFYVLFFIVLLLSSKDGYLEPSYAYSAGACNEMSDSLLTSLEMKNVELTYECFGAVGDGTTNDFDAIKKAHAFANKEYVEKGIFITVHGTAGKNYYVGANSSVIPVATSTNFHGANIILDDGGHGVDPTKVFLRVTSPMFIETGNNSITYSKYTNMKCIDNGTTCITNTSITNSNVWKNLHIMSNTTNIKKFVDSVLEDTIKMDSKSLKYFQTSQNWVVNVTDRSRNYIRSGSNADTGKAQSENILVNRITGDIIGNINWNYNDMIEIKVWPVPEKNVMIQNGDFTTLTNNVAFDKNGKKTASSKRNIQVYFTGNVTIQNINHYLDETVYPNNNGEQVNSNANGYYGFINLSNASYVTLKNVNLTPHTYTKKTDLSDGFATYDLIFDQSLNLFFDNVGYACKGDASECYNNYMVNSNRWGIIGSNGSKNVFIRNSKLNRIDSHIGLRNLYVENTIVGDKGLTLIGSGSVYLKNVTVDRANNFVTLRSDYGSTWNGTLILEDVEYILPSGSGMSNIIYSNNSQKNYGYTTYFPDVYLKNVTLNNQKYNSSNDVTILRLSERASSSGSSKYKFKGNVRFTNVRFKNSKNNLYLFTDRFVSRDDDLLLESYFDTNTVEIGYTNNDSNFKYAPSSSSVTKLNSNQNTKFTFKNSSEISSIIDSKIASLSSVVNEREVTSKMPKSLEGDFSLQKIMINNGAISLNENISSTCTQYTTNVLADTVSVKLNVQANGKFLSIVYPDTVPLMGEKTTVIIQIFGVYGSSKTYILDIYKAKEFDKVVAPTAITYCNELSYNGQPQIITKEAGVGFHFVDNKQTEAGEYAVKAVLNSGYRWNDNTTTDKTIVCTLKKAIPTINLNVPSKQILLNQTANFMESANVNGTFVNSTITPTILSVSAGNKSEAMAENSLFMVSVNGLASGLGIIQVDFSPVDSINWQPVTKKVQFAVNDRIIDNYQDSNANFTVNGNANFTVKSEKKYFASESFLYTCNDNNNSTIENNLTFKDGLTYEFENNSLLLKDENGTENIISLVNFQTALEIEDETMYIPEEMSLEQFMGTIQTNGVTISVENLNSNYISTGSIVNVFYQNQIVDTYVIKIKTLEPQKTGEGNYFLFGINPILLIIYVDLMVVVILVLIIFHNNKKLEFIKQGSSDVGGSSERIDSNNPDGQ